MGTREEEDQAEGSADSLCFFSSKVGFCALPHCPRRAKTMRQKHVFLHLSSLLPTIFFSAIQSLINMTLVNGNRALKRTPKKQVCPVYLFFPREDTARHLVLLMLTLSFCAFRSAKVTQTEILWSQCVWRLTDLIVEL